MIIKMYEDAGFFWTDEHNNKWNTNRCSKEEAEKYSASLSHCCYCYNCRDCSYCTDCKDCRNCRSCGGCYDCADCGFCNGCTDCKYCWECDICSSCNNCERCWKCSSCVRCSNCDCCSLCSNCNACDDCSACTECKYCRSFSKNPERIDGPVIESENGRPSVYWVEVGQEQCRVGNFIGTLDEVEKDLEEEYKDNYELLSQYRQFIKVVRAYQEITK